MPDWSDFSSRAARLLQTPGLFREKLASSDLRDRGEEDGGTYHDSEVTRYLVELRCRHHDSWTPSLRRGDAERWVKCTVEQRVGIG